MPKLATAMPLPELYTAVIGAMKPKEDPRYDGRMFLLINRNRAVENAVKNSVVDGSKWVRIGTRNVAPNMATTCCAPISIVRGQVRRSLGSTTSPGPKVLPLPCSFQWNMVQYITIVRPSLFGHFGMMDIIGIGKVYVIPIVLY